MLAVGKELLIGRTLNTNAHWVGGRLARLGSMLKEVTTTDDDLQEIAAALTASLARTPDFLIVVGGLGPTPDDMTLKGLAVGLGVGLAENPRALTLIKEHYATRGMADIELTPARRKMAVLPEGAEPILNVEGTAPGVRISSGETVIFSLPGVPSEMRGIYKRSVEPEVKRRLGDLHRSYVRMKLEGIAESTLAPMIVQELQRHPAAYVKSHPRGLKGGVSHVEIDVAVVGTDRVAVESEGEEIARSLTKSARESGASVRRVNVGTGR